MTDALIEGGTLLASRDDRTVRGLLLPWNEQSRKSNIGPIEFPRGVLRIPRDPSVIGANVAHNREDPRGRATLLEDTDAGLVATFAIADTDEGDQLLTDIETGKLTRLSAEIKGIVRDGARAVAGALFGAAFVTEGAFESAALYAELAPVTESVTPDPLEPVDGVLELTATSTPDEVIVHTPDAESVSFTQKESDMTDAVVPNTLAASAVTTDAPLTKREAFQIMYAAKAGQADQAMLARLQEGLTTESGLFALTDVKYNGTGSVTPHANVPQWVDEMWAGVSYVQKIVPLFGHKDLTARTVSGFQWTTKPTGAAWAGNKANIPSNTPVTAAYTMTAAGWAGGHDHAIEHEIFNTPGYFDSYFAAMAESYAAWVDAKVLTDILAVAETIEADNPTGITVGAGISALIDGATELIANNAQPSFALVAPALWKATLKTGSDTVLTYLTSALSLESGSLDGFTIRPHASLTAGNVLVGAREAVDVYELPGTPIRVTAPDTVKGGIDTNVIGFAGTFIHKADGLVLITPYTP